MKTKFYLLVLAVIFIIVNSCGNSSNENQMKANSTPNIKSSEANSGSKDWDKLLDYYESYTNKFISLLKKSMAGDMSAMSEYPALMEKATEFENELQNAGDNLTEKQMARFIEIQTKLIESASESMGSTFGSMEQTFELLDEKTE